MAGPDSAIEMPALGRPFRLGMLYDCHRDALLLEHSLVDSKMCGKRSEQTEETKVWKQIPSDTIREKAAALDITPSLLTSLLCGLFEVNGCAKYLLSAKKFRHLGSLTYQSLAIERLEMLDLNDLGSEYFSFPPIGKWVATHVVTGVWYGDQSISDYHQEVSATENVPENVRRTDVENTVFPVQGTTPSKTAKSLGESTEKGVAIKVRLYPLTKLGLKVPQMQCANVSHEISSNLNSEIVGEMEGLFEIEARCNDLSKSPAATTFPEIRNKIHQFRNLCQQHKQDFQKQLAEIVPLVREGQKEEKDLEEVLERKRQSPFNNKGLSRFLDKKKQEVACVNELLVSLKEAEAICCKQELSNKILCPSSDFTVVFVFTSLHEEEPYFSELKAFQSSQKQPEKSQRETRSSTEWYEDEAVIKRTRDMAKSFSAFAHANRSSKTTQFLVASIQDDGNPGASVYLYESGVLEKTNFEPPSKPLPIQIEEISQDRVQLRLTPALHGKDAISSYQVEGRTVGQEEWEHLITSRKNETVTVTSLCPDTEYEFRYAAVSKPGLSESSDISRSVRTLPASLPETPKETHGGSLACFLVSQDIEAEGRNTDCITASTPVKNKEWGSSSEQNPREEMETIRGPLTSASNPLSDDPEGDQKSLASSLGGTSALIRKGCPSIYALALEKSVYGGSATCVKYRYGRRENPQINHKVIMLVGETGAGKSTLINRMVNCILGVKWEDDFRFCLVQDSPKRSQAHSQTDRLTVYEFNWDQRLQAPFSLTLIDTPGFGDTRGINHDRRLLEEIQEFFSTQDGVNHMDAICLVVQASQARLTQSQKYIFDAVLSIFGKDIRDNIRILITFADAQTPPVLEAIKASDVPCARDAMGAPLHFAFNNSALFARNVQEDEDSYRMNQKIWEMGERNMDRFFQAIKDLEPQSLTLTRAVLNERMELQAAVQSMKPHVQMVLVKLQELKKIRAMVQKHLSDIDANRNFEYEVERVEAVRKEISDKRYRAVNCQECKYTCHYFCKDQRNSGKWKYTIMGDDCQHCRFCPGKCPLQIHHPDSYEWGHSFVKEKQSSAQLKKRYQAACERLMTEKKAYEQLKHEYEQAFEDLVKLIKTSSYHLQRLQKIALKPNLITASEYIDLLISSEEKELQSGYAERIEILKSVKGRVSTRGQSLIV